MADISAYITAIESASRGEEVRDSITGALNAINEASSYGVATPSANGLMSSTDKTLLDAIPTPTASDSGKYLRVNTSGGWELVAVSNAEEVSF